ncbi:MAG: multidrug effflux MFS transporter [Hyphomonadaceae bacterium]|nr:multidrug effflux MFS transporter [Hyphomonadaceae bacterium]
MTSPTIRTPSTPELVAMVASFLALNALGIDIMLPALPDIAAAYAVTVKADEQLVLFVYLMSFGVAQLFYGPLSDSYGRRPVLLVSMVVYLMGTLLCLLAPTFEVFLLARAVQGASAAAARVIAVAVVRDLMAGREMARVMSLAMMVFMVVPILAPGLGQLVLLAGPWQWIFGFLFAAGAIIMAWTWLRLPETRPRDLRTPFDLGGALRSYGVVMRNRLAMGYTLAAAVAFGSLFGFLATAQPLFVDVFGLGVWFPLAFATVAGVMSMASFINARFVTRFGMRRMSHAALTAFTALSAVHVLLLLAGPTPLWRYMLLLAPAMLMFGMIGANFSAIAMEPLGARAGVGSAFNGFATTTLSALLGALIGRLYDGSPLPLIAGHLALGLGALAIVWVTERGRLFGTGPAG